MQIEPARDPRTSQPRRSVRTILLGATAAVAAAGVIGQASLSTGAAQAAAPAAQTQGISPPSFADIVDRVRGAVVSVKVTLNGDEDDNSAAQSMPGFPQLQPGDPLERFFRQFQEGQRGQQHRQRPRGMAQGSGFIISSDGYVVTNNHVVDHAGDVKITLDDGRTVDASIVGTDKKTDLALLKIKSGGNYQHVNFSSAVPRVGEWVIAVGNPFGLGGTVTAGIVSARGRDIGSGPYDDYLQIDAPVNRGNSGGPTFNANGDVVGVNTAIYSPSGGSVGIGFAIPSEVASTVIESLKDHGSVSRGWIGVQIQPVTPEIAESLGTKGTNGALVADVQSNAPAKAAGLKAGDVITAVNGDKVDGPRELARRIASLGPDKSVNLTYLRDGSEKTAEVKLGSLPNDREARANAPAQSEKSSLTRWGLRLSPSDDGTGVQVAEVDPDGVAAQKGLRTGDVILDVGGKPVTRPGEVQAALNEARSANRKAVLLRVKSEQGTRFVALATNPTS
jgi:serine protease Do